eukprot:3735080-Amphidinium_carterae.1
MKVGMCCSLLTPRTGVGGSGVFFAGLLVSILRASTADLAAHTCSSEPDAAFALIHVKHQGPKKGTTHSNCKLLGKAVGACLVAGISMYKETTCKLVWGGTCHHIWTVITATLENVRMTERLASYPSQ